MPQLSDSDIAALSAEPAAGAARTDQFFYPGASELISVRQSLIRSSLRRAAKRLRESRAGAGAENNAARAETLANMANVSSEVGARSFSCVRFNADGSHIAVSDWSGRVAVRRGETEVWSVEAHEPRAQCVAWLHHSELILLSA